MMRLVSMWVLAGIVFFGIVTSAAAERNWEFSVGAFGGKAYHAETTAHLSYAVTSAGLEPVDAKARGLKFDDSATFGAKLSAWYLPRKYNWSPQIGLELDWTSYTADLQPQTVSGEGVGKISGQPLGDVVFTTRRDFPVNNLAVNLLFRYPILATPEMPHGRWYPYVGVGTGVQRARMSLPVAN